MIVFLKKKTENNIQLIRDNALFYEYLFLRPLQNIGNLL